MNAKQYAQQVKTCEACACGTGPGYMQTLSTFRYHALCTPCSMAWPVLDKYFQEGYGRDATWQEFLNPPTPKLDEQGRKIYPPEKI